MYMLVCDSFYYVGDGVQYDNEWSERGERRAHRFPTRKAAQAFLSKNDCAVENFEILPVLLKVKATNAIYTKVVIAVAEYLQSIDIPSGWVGGQWGNGQTDDTTVYHERGAFHVYGTRAKEVSEKLAAIVATA